MDSVLAEGLRLREAGWAVHWLREKSKAPFESDWTTAPVKSVSELRNSYRPGYNVGFRPGTWSPVGEHVLVVLDVDVRGGEKYAEEAYAAAKTLTGTDDYHVKSGSGLGRHMYYACPRGRAPASAATTLRECDVVVDDKPAWKIELLATGKNVVLPPSVHPETGQRYQRLNDELSRPIPEAILNRLAELGGKDVWPEPEEIQTKLLPVPKLQRSLLPPPLAPWIIDVASRMQCPFDYVAGPVVVAAASLIGARVGVRPKQKDNWTVIPNLWGGIVGSPGMLKSPAMKAALAVVEELERKAKADFDAASSSHLMEKLSTDLARDALKKQMTQHLKNKPHVNDMFTTDPKLRSFRSQLTALTDTPEPTWRRFKTNDSTVEKVVELEAGNPNGLLMFRDELVGFLATLEREDRPTDRAFYLEAWAGDQSYTADRIGRGTVHAERNCLSILGGIQPSKLSAYMHGTLENYANDGFIQRFQVLVYPDEPPTWKYIDRKPNEKAGTRAFKLLTKLADVNFEDLGAEVAEDDRGRAKTSSGAGGVRRGQRYFRFAEDAQRFFIEWLTELETTKIRGQETELMVQHLSKYRSLMPSLALILHVVDLIDTGRKGPISLSAAQRAAAWCEYLEAHARRIYGLVTGQAREGVTVLISKIRGGELAGNFSERDVYRKGWSFLTEPEYVARACRELEDSGWIRRVRQQRGPAGGRPPSPVYEINPKIKRVKGPAGR